MIIDDEKIFYRNTFGKEFYYDIEDIKTVTRRHYKYQSVIIEMKDNKKIIISKASSRNYGLLRKYLEERGYVF